jgi:hypothetical protein
VERSETQHQHLGYIRLCIADLRLTTVVVLVVVLVGWVERSETQHQHLGYVRLCIADLRLTTVVVQRETRFHQSK